MAATLAFNLTGGAANSNPNTSLGGVHSSVALSVTAMNNLFDDVTPAQASAGSTEYRAIDVTNTGDALSAVTKVFMNPETSSTSTQLDMGIEASPLGSTLSIVNESTAPAAVSFAHYNTGSKLTLPDIAAGAYCRVWVRRVVSASAPNTSNDTGTFTVEYA